MKKRSLAISLLALASLSLASCQTIDDAAEKELARSIVAGFKTTDKVGYRATVTGSIRGNLWNSDNNDEENIIEGRIGTSYVQFQEWVEAHRKNSGSGGSSSADSEENEEDETDSFENSSELEDQGDENLEDEDPDVEDGTAEDEPNEEEPSDSEEESKENPYIDAKDEESSAVFLAPTLITPESFDIAYDGMTDGSIFGCLTNNTRGVLQCEATGDGGIRFYVENFSSTLYIYGICTGGYQTGRHSATFNPDDEFRINSRWNLDIYYGSDGVIKEEKIQNIHSYTDDPTGNVTLHVTYEVY